MRGEGRRGAAALRAALLAGLLAAPGSGCSAGGEPRSARASRVVVFPAPKGIAASPDYRLRVNGNEVFCYAARASRGHWFDRKADSYRFRTGPAAFAVFDFDGRVKVEIPVRAGLVADPGKLRIRPLARRVEHRLRDGVLTFELDRIGDLTIDPGGDGNNVLHLFVNRPEREAFRKDDPNVVYFGPGVHRIDRQIRLKSGQTLYLAGGAVLLPDPPAHKKARLHAIYNKGRKRMRHSPPVICFDRAENVSVRGRGVMLGEGTLARNVRLRFLRAVGARKVRVRDVVMAGGSAWNVHFQGGSEIEIDRVRIVGHFGNTDGFCIDGCTNVKVTNCFYHGYDDCLEVKAMNAGRACSNVRFENCQVWSGCGSPMGVTHEISAPVRDITWKNITVLYFDSSVIRDPFRKTRAAIFVHSARNGPISGLRFEDITVENARGRMIYLGNESEDSKAREWSSIRDVTFRNVRAQGVKDPRISLVDRSGKGIVRDISFENVVVNGEKLVENDKRIVRRGVGKVEVK
jgi:hypothetical protein